MVVVPETFAGPDDILQRAREVAARSQGAPAYAVAGQVRLLTARRLPGNLWADALPPGERERVRTELAIFPGGHVVAVTISTPPVPDEPSSPRLVGRPLRGQHGRHHDWRDELRPDTRT